MSVAAPPPPRLHLIDRLAESDPELIRLDITASAFVDYTRHEKEDFIAALQSCRSIRHVHLSGDGLEGVMDAEQTDLLIDALGYVENLEELFVFKGDNPEISGSRLAKTVKYSTKLKVFMIWGFASIEKEHELAGAIRNHLRLERVTVTLPTRCSYACLDVFVMGFAGMQRLKCLCLRCRLPQKEAAISPEAISLLFRSRSLESIYVENCGLCDDHSDAIADELATNNAQLTLLDLKHNLFSDDALYAFALCLKKNRTLKSLDLSGAYISEGGVYALATALEENPVITHVELEGDESRFRDEFAIPDGHSRTPYMQALDFRLRLNRAGKRENRQQFAEALNMVSDHLDCLYHLVRRHPIYFDLQRSHKASF
jgi:Ran GTPase-activating protein (RanGAP) involved in mRNA processing and transport